MSYEHERELAMKLEDRLARFIDKASFEVIPPGTLGKGMGFKQTNKTENQFNEESEEIILTATVTIRVYSTKKPS